MRDLSQSPCSCAQCTFAVIVVSCNQVLHSGPKNVSMLHIHEMSHSHVCVNRRQWTVTAVSAVSEAACIAQADELHATLQAFSTSHAIPACSLSVPTKLGASAAAGSTYGLLSY